MYERIQWCFKRNSKDFHFHAILRVSCVQLQSLLVHPKYIFHSSLSLISQFLLSTHRSFTSSLLYDDCDLFLWHSTIRLLSHCWCNQAVIHEVTSQKWTLAIMYFQWLRCHASKGARAHTLRLAHNDPLCARLTEMWTLEQIKMSVGGRNILLDEREGKKRQYIFFRVLQTRARTHNFSIPFGLYAC